MLSILHEDNEEYVNLICQYLITVEYPNYDESLIQDDNLLNNPKDLGPWTGRKRIFGRQVKDKAAQMCLQCPFAKPLTSNGKTEIYCSYNFN